MQGSRGADLVCVLVGFAIRRAARVCWVASSVAGKSRGTDCTSGTSTTKGSVHRDFHSAFCPGQETFTMGLDRS